MGPPRGLYKSASQCLAMWIMARWGSTEEEEEKKFYRTVYAAMTVLDMYAELGLSS